MGKKRRGERAKKDSGGWGNALQATAAAFDAQEVLPHGAAAAAAGEEGQAAPPDLHAAVAAQRKQLQKFWKEEGAAFCTWWLDLPRQDKVGCRGGWRPGLRSCWQQ